MVRLSYNYPHGTTSIFVLKELTLSHKSIIYSVTWSTKLTIWELQLVVLDCSHKKFSSNIPEFEVHSFLVNTDMCPTNSNKTVQFATQTAVMFYDGKRDSYLTPSTLRDELNFTGSWNDSNGRLHHYARVEEEVSYIFD